MAVENISYYEAEQYIRDETYAEKDPRNFPTLPRQRMSNDNDQRIEPRDSYRNAVVSGQKSKTPISPGYGRQNHKMCMMNYRPGQDQGNAIMLRNNTQKNLCREQGHIPSTSGIGNSQNQNKEYIKSMSINGWKMA
ncbi:hypothetical protein HHI36_023935 [Cryptolaemus montrouzieri]|uniref:Uncharacterized protein n=1 Tax=Cryptolaemus montrouzieri TaxID=559131 RepID=A0ABD2NCB6_9CUCU